MADARLIVLALAMSASVSGESSAADHVRAGARGQADYATYCAPCHGERGAGDGPLARMLDPAPARHSDAAFMNGLSDEYLFRLLKTGGQAFGKSPLMGAWGKILSEERLRDLIVFLRSLGTR